MNSTAKAIRGLFSHGNNTHSTLVVRFDFCNFPSSLTCDIIYERRLTQSTKWTWDTEADTMRIIDLRYKQYCNEWLIKTKFDIEQMLS